VFGPRQLARHPARLRFLANPIEPAWGEPYTDQVDRMRSVVEDARRQAAGGEAVLVGHQSPIWALRRALAGRPAWGLPGRRQCALASVTTLTYAAGRLTAVRYSEPWRFTQASPPRS
jgi:broad specificity phosphatase PhoE